MQPPILNPPQERGSGGRGALAAAEVGHGKHPGFRVVRCAHHAPSSSPPNCEFDGKASRIAVWIAGRMGGKTERLLGCSFSARPHSPHMPIAQPEVVLEFLKRAHDGMQPLSTKISFDKVHPLHRNLIALYGSILELTGAIILLVDRRLITGVPVVLRSVLEAYVDLHNLSESPTYGYSLELGHIKEWLKILVEAKAGKNEYLTAITEAPDLDSAIADWSKKKITLENKGYRALRVEQKFQRAGMEKEYRSQYNSLCCDAHNNLRALIDRHIEMNGQGFELVYYKAYTPEDSAIHVGTNAELLVRASQKLHSFFKSPVENEVAAYRAELDNLRGEA